jgi:spore germination protein GerM
VKRPVLALVLLLASCGGTSGPIEIPREELPFSVTRTAAATNAPARGDEYSVYLVREGRLFSVARRPDASGRRPTAILRSLIAGPTSNERARRIATLVPPSVRVLNVDVAEDHAEVDLSSEFQEPAPPETIALRVAQVVWTLTGLDEVRTVSFAIDGEPVSVTTDSGDHVERRLTRRDYADFAPRD